MKIAQQDWGMVEGQDLPVKLITLENSNGMKVSLTNFGCIVTSIETPDRDGKIDDVVLGYESLDKYLAGHPFFGAIAGRFANRIKDGKYSIDGEQFTLETNEPPTEQHLHGGSKGFDKHVWNYAVCERDNGIFVELYRISPDGEMGYGGTLNVVHTIGLDEDNQLHFNFKATTDKPTIVNLVNHSYYNLGGHDSGSVEGHELKLFADYYTPTAENMIPTGEILKVTGGLDFTAGANVGENMMNVADKAIDHNFVLHQRDVEGEYALAAELFEPKSGRVMTVLTTQPGVQFYNGSKLSNKQWFARNGFKYEAFGGLCLETQHFPNSPNQSHFPSVRLNSSEVFEEKTIHRFSIR
jgi:aldose 1-epimerase